MYILQPHPMSAKSSKNTTAAAPFDDPDADLIIRTADHVDFHVYKRILSLASPVFNTMISLPQSRSNAPEGGDTPEASLVDVTEPSRMWDLLLRICYPMMDPRIDGLDDIRLLLEAAQKYEIAFITEKMGQTLLLPPFSEEEPLRIFALAYTYALDDVGRRAARATLRSPLGVSRAKELQYIPASTFHELWAYHLACGKVAHELASRNWGWISNMNATFFTCDNDDDECPRRRITLASGKRYRPKAYWVNYMERAGKLLLDQPDPSVLVLASLVEPTISAAMTCGICARTIRRDMSNFIIRFGKEITKAVSTVPLNVKYPSS